MSYFHTVVQSLIDDKNKEIDQFKKYENTIIEFLKELTGTSNITKTVTKKEDYMYSIMLVAEVNMNPRTVGSQLFIDLDIDFNNGSIKFAIPKYSKTTVTNMNKQSCKTALKYLLDHVAEYLVNEGGFRG